MAVTDEEYQLNSQRVTQILGDRLFYAQCPIFMFMEESAMARYVQHMAEVVRGRDGNCSGCDDKSKQIIDPAIAEFVRHTKKLHDRDTNLLDELRGYLAEKLGYRPKCFVLYYTEGERRRALKF